MTCAGPSRRPSVSLHGVRALLATLLAALVVVGPALAPASPGGQPAHAAETDQLSVSIDTLSPATLRAGSTLSVTGRITNPTERTWTRVRVYLVIPTTPLTVAADVDETLADPSEAATGTRLTDLDLIATAGDLSPGDTTTFRLDVPFGRLGISGASGVYPVGAQVLATAPDGTRSNDAIGRAHTVVPYVADGAAAAPARTSVVWPFIDPVQRDDEGALLDPASLVAAVSPGGRLDRLLSLARSDDSAPATVLVDPALLDALRDLALGTSGPARVGGPGGAAAYDPQAAVDDETSTQRVVRTFLGGLLEYAQRHTVWTVAYGRPDTAALGRKRAGPSGAAVSDAAQRSSVAVLAQMSLNPVRTVTWPPNGITNRGRLDRARALGASAAVLSTDVLSGWTPADSGALRVDTIETTMDALVLDPALQPTSVATASTLALRQRLVSRAALAALDPASPAVALVVDPAFDPGPEWERAAFYSAFAPEWVSPVGADSQLGTRATAWPGRVKLPGRSRQRPISPEQVDAAASILSAGSALDELLGASPARSVYFDQSAALATSQGWRQARTRGLRHAQEQASAVAGVTNEVTVSVTSFVTLSGSSGKFPVTITNGLDRPVTVGVRFTSASASTRIPAVEAAEVDPGDSITLTVTAEAGQATTTAVTARLVTSDGTAVGLPTRFTVRSSVVGRVVWIFLALAVLLVVVAVGRRVVRSRRRRGPTTTPTSTEAP